MSTTVPASGKSAFSRALDEYIQSRPAKSKTPQFIQTLQEQQRAGLTLNEDGIKKDIIQLERNATDRKAAQAARKILRPVVNMLSTYTGVVDTLVQADPMPTAVIWGALKAVISASSRFLDLYDKLSDQIERLCTHIETLTGYEELFGDSSAMQQLLQASYVSIFRFWRRVEKECNRGVTNRMFRSVAPFSTTKIDDLVASIGNTADDMSRLIPVVQGRLERREREDAAEERRLAGIARADQKLLFQMYEEDLEKRNEERKQHRQREVQEWLRAGKSLLNESNFRHQNTKQGARSPGTCEWLLQNEQWKSWVDVQSPVSQLLIRAAPGVGKSVLAAYAVDMLSMINPDGPAIIHQYYTCDDDFPALLVYRCLADQLASKLGKHTGDMPEEIHSFTQQGATSARIEDVHTVMRMLVEKLPVTYIILDGLDEMCDTEKRRRDLYEVIDFLQQLASAAPGRLRVWYSSQSRACLDSRLSMVPSIEVTKDLNSSDIEKYLSMSIVDLDSLELDEGYSNLILQELREKADGCFLWASLMLNSMSNAITLQMVQQLIDEGLPDNYERYYRRKMESIDPNVRGFVSLLLACIVHAKRPLRLEELCECTAMARADEGQDLNSNEKLVKSRVLQLCQPLVQVHESEIETGETISICTLTHRSVRSFLLKNPDILQHGPDPNEYALDSKPMADICLKYLMQPRYGHLLCKRNDTYADKYGSDIMDHHLLTYAAKYWDRHLDHVKASTDVCDSVTKLLRSAQFFTLLQVQSLFVEGHFTDWLNTLRPWAGRHFRRVFPHWLEESCTEAFSSNYESFVNEWGFLLNEETGMDGSHEGEIDRCFFGALGDDNVLHNGPSRYKSLMFLENEGKAIQAPIRCFDAVDADGTQLRVVKMEALNTEQLVLTCERWDLNGPQSKLQGVQWLRVSSENWPLYEYPLSEKVFGRPDFVSFSGDLNYMRIGSQVFMQGDDLDYKRLPISEIYFDEIASKGNLLALTTRRPVNTKDIEVPEEADSGKPVDCAELMVQELKARMKLMDESAGATNIDSTVSTQPTTTITTESNSDELSSPSSASSVVSNDPDDAESTADQKSWAASSDGSNTDKLLLQSSSESAGNSAYTSWSEGSTEHLSDDVEEDDQWNDWDYRKLNPEEWDLEERGSLKSDDNQSFDADVESHLSESDSDIPSIRTGEIWCGTASGSASRSNSPSSSDNSSSSNGSSSSDSYGTYSGSDGDSDDSENEEGARLEDMMLGRRAANGDGSKRTSIRLYDASRPESVPVFHYNGFVKGDLFNSPPAFHPTKPLLVWPLGDGDILFANHQANTYFTRQLCRSAYNSCHVFIKTHFSSDGQYLHFAALEAGDIKAGGKETDVEESGSVHLKLQVSTHRLSSRKTASSPPRLAFRTTIDIGVVASIPVSNLPFFVAWADRDLFFLTRGRSLDITRIPLFRIPEQTGLSICSLKEQIFLPRSIDSRSMHFVPAPETSVSESTANRKRVKRFASLILGSYCSSPSRGVLVPKNVCDNPIAVFLREDRDLLWHCKANSAEAEGMPLVNSSCGRLKGKFESFDHEEDCDIVPYFF